MMRGSALETTVEARIETNRPIIRPDSAWRTPRRDILAGGPAGNSVPTVSAGPGELVVVTRVSLS
ncbi:hypothetical protein GCM10009539_51200 [Cryptosporangium japonicum]|uniref:Uncharacterized protein n=1 Tax=Cryptosporangium japonicum TaxID=80872 RepID=A0ABP3EGG1_9ACTN